MIELVPAYTCDGIVYDGTPQEALAATVNAGDAISYRKHDGRTGVGIVKYNWMYDGPMLTLHDGVSVVVSCGDMILSVMRNPGSKE